MWVRFLLPLPILFLILIVAVVAKWLTHLIVVQAFVGSIPISRPIYKYLGIFFNYSGGCGEVVNAPDCGSGIRGFDSHQSPHYYWGIAKR